ncbi:hypothetical protein BH20ACT21_BH20ACT21_16910 [soil metagenome]
MTSRPSGAGPTRLEALRGHRPRRCVSRADAHVEIGSIALGEILVALRAAALLAANEPAVQDTLMTSEACEADQLHCVDAYADPELHSSHQALYSLPCNCPWCLGGPIGRTPASGLSQDAAFPVTIKAALDEPTDAEVERRRRLED